MSIKEQRSDGSGESSGMVGNRKEGHGEYEEAFAVAADDCGEFVRSVSRRFARWLASRIYPDLETLEESVESLKGALQGTLEAYTEERRQHGISIDARHQIINENLQLRLQISLSEGDADTARRLSEIKISNTKTKAQKQ